MGGGGVHRFCREQVRYVHTSPLLGSLTSWSWIIQLVKTYICSPCRKGVAQSGHLGILPFRNILLSPLYPHFANMKRLGITILIEEADKPFVIEYVDLIRFNSQGKIAYIKEFFDNHHMQTHLTEHEEKKAT